MGISEVGTVYETGEPDSWEIGLDGFEWDDLGDGVSRSAQILVHQLGISTQ